MFPPYGSLSAVLSYQAQQSRDPQGSPSSCVICGLCSSVANDLEFTISKRSISLHMTVAIVNLFESVPGNVFGRDGHHHERMRVFFLYVLNNLWYVVV